MIICTNQAGIESTDSSCSQDGHRQRNTSHWKGKENSVNVLPHHLIWVKTVSTIYDSWHNAGFNDQKLIHTKGLVIKFMGGYAGR